MGRNNDRAHSYGRTEKCPICGKSFFVEDVGMWVYRERTKRGRLMGFICSWHCQVEHNRALEQQRKTTQKWEDPKLWDAAKDVPQRSPARRWYWLGKLEAVMRERGLSDRVLAEMIGAKRSTVSQWRRVDNRCPENKVDDLTEVLGVGREDLVTGESVVGEWKKAPRDGSDHTMPVSDGNTDT